jgi:putative transposase
MDAPGGTFFLTWVTYERRLVLRSVENVARLGSAIAEVKRIRPFEIIAAVILPDHVHFLWDLPEGDSDYSRRVGMIKVWFTRSLQGMEPGMGNVSKIIGGRCPPYGLSETVGGRCTPHNLSYSRRRHRESTVWQRRFWEHTIRDDRDFATHMDYIHYNPVKHELAACPHAWAYSSFHHWVREGYYDTDWACCCAGRRVSPPSFDEIAERVGE